MAACERQEVPHQLLQTRGPDGRGVRCSRLRILCARGTDRQRQGGGGGKTRRILCARRPRRRSARGQGLSAGPDFSLHGILGQECRRRHQRLLPGRAPLRRIGTAEREVGGGQSGGPPLCVRSRPRGFLSQGPADSVHRGIAAQGDPATGAGGRGRRGGGVVVPAS